MPFGIPSVETGTKENRNKKNVITNILTIQGLRSVNTEGVNPLDSISGVFGKVILNDLPESVKSFTYSEMLPNITATREIGTESWNGKQAFDWALSDQSERVRAGVLEMAGEIT